MNTSSALCHAVIRRTAIVLCLSFSISACVSYEPAVLVPAVTLSAEEVSLAAMTTSENGVDFGLVATVNESDSLFNVEILPGIRVQSVSANGPAANAGIQVGDTILEVNGTATNNPDALQAVAQLESESNEYRFLVQRNTLVFEASVIARTVNPNPPAISLYRIDPLATRAGYRTELVNIGEDGPIAAATIAELFPYSPLPGAGLSIGDTILTLEGRYLNSAQDLVSRLNREHELGDSVTVTRFRAGELEEIRFELWDPGRRISRISLGPLFRYDSALSPESESISILDLWLFSVYSYVQQEGERSHSLLGLINFSSDAGELVDETN